MDDDAIAVLSATALTRGYATGEFSPVDVARTLLDRIARLDPLVNAFVHVDATVTIMMAEASAGRYRQGQPFGPLDGVPVSIKDLLAVAGWPLGRGSLALAGQPPSVADASPVARLREAGAIFLGKTATAEAGSRIVTRSPRHGVTLNPYDLSRTPGGSSGGAAAALALGLGPLALGTDGAGSIRIPAAWTGTFGLKPSFGRVPAYPPGIFMPHSVTGPMSRSVEDATLMLAVLAEPDRRDPYAWPVPFDADAARFPVSGLRVGVTHDFGMRSPPVDDAILAAVDTATKALADAGAIVGNVAPIWPVDPYDSFLVFWEATYAGFLPIGYPEAVQNLVDSNLRAIAERGRKIDIVAYHRALADRVALAASATALFQDVDILLGPVIPCSPPRIATDAPPGFEADDWRWCPFTYLWNMTGQPAASVPWGFDHDGLPLGIQLVGRVGAEAEILRVARALESASPPMSPPLLPGLAA